MRKEEARLIKELTLHPWWKVLKDELNGRIEELEQVLFATWKLEEEYANARMERKAMIKVLEEPEAIIGSF